jgi:hypothetical protein
MRPDCLISQSTGVLFLLKASMSIAVCKSDMTVYLRLFMAALHHTRTCSDVGSANAGLICSAP